MPLFVWVTLLPQAGRANDVESVIRTMVSPTRAEPGCRRYDVYRAQPAGGEEPTLHLYEIYDDQAAVEAHRAADYYGAYRNQVIPLLTEPPTVRFLSAVDVAPF